MKPSLLIAMMSTVLFAQDSGTVAGRVTDSATGFGIPGVAVELRQRDVFYQATTDESGAFRMTGVKYGDYGGRTVQKAGYDLHQDAPFFAGGGVRVHGPDPVRWDIQMDPWTTLHGHVVDADGKPAAKVHVQLGPMRDNETLTDESGAFAFQKLKPGSYTLWAKPDPKGQIQEGVRVEAVPTYFPSTVDSSQTERVVIRGGVDLPDYEIRLRTSPVYHVRGLVLNDLGKPAPHAAVKLLRPAGQGTQAYGRLMIGSAAASQYMIVGPAGARPEIEVVSGEDGKFEFPSVPPGDWRVEAGADPVHDTVQDDYVVSTGGTSAIVTAHDIEDLEIKLAAPFELKFTYDWEDAPQPQDFQETLRPALIPLDGQSQPGLLDANARFLVLPGRYRIVPPLFMQRYYVTSVLLGGREVLGQEVDLAPGSPALRVVYKTGLGSVRGTVEKGEGATVVLVAQSPNGLSFIRTSKCGLGGAFDMDGVTPGDYAVVAFDRVETQPMESAGFIGSVRPSSVSVHVEEGAAASVELHLTRWQ